jgi:hypothetical protein
MVLQTSWGQFWASNSDSDTNDEVDFTVDNLAASMSNLSLTSPVRSPGSVSKSSALIKVSEPPVVVAMKDKVHPASSTSTKGCRIGVGPPW